MYISPTELACELLPYVPPGPRALQPLTRFPDAHASVPGAGVKQARSRADICGEHGGKLALGRRWVVDLRRLIDTNYILLLSGSFDEQLICPNDHKDKLQNLHLLRFHPLPGRC